MFRFLGCLLLPLFLSIPLRAASQPAPRFAAGERWCAIGDSITHNGTYHQWIALYHLTRFPEVCFEVINCGISGDSAARALRRFPWDIAPHEPTYATLMFGMNDVNRRLYDPTNAVTPEILSQRREQLELYRASMRQLVSQLQERGVRVVLLTPSPYDQTSGALAPKHSGVNDALAECTNFLRQLGQELEIPVVDFHTPLTRLTLRQQRDHSGFSLNRTDRVHPELPAHFLMACLFLQAQNAPAEVSCIVIDAAKTQETAVSRGRVTNLKKDGMTLSFTWAASALPFPLFASVQPALSWFSFNDELNREMLQITGLTPGTYELRIDDRLISTYSAESLAAGVNLAEETDTPQYQQALTVALLWEKRTQLVANDLRGLAFVEHRSFAHLPRPLQMDDTKAIVKKELEARQRELSPSFTRQQYEKYFERKSRETDSHAEVARLTEDVRRAAKPTPHVYTLTLVR